MREELEPTAQSKKSKIDVKCSVCGEIYPTSYQLSKHQNEKNHKLGKGRLKRTSNTEYKVHPVAETQIHTCTTHYDTHAHDSFQISLKFSFPTVL